MVQIGTEIIKGVYIVPLKKIDGKGGSVMHVLKKEDALFENFGEVYISTIKENFIKGWKKHTKMISNLVVPIGEVEFVFFDDRKGSATYGQFKTVILSTNNYCRLTIEPGVWMAFKGIAKEESYIINCASMQHLPDECLQMPIEDYTVIPKYF